MNKVDFLKSWRGPAGNLTLGADLRWKSSEEKKDGMRVFGSSLTPADEKVLNDGGVVCHKKPVLYTKLFVKDENNLLWSIVIPNKHLPDLMQKLKNVGYELPTPAA